jgi:hypothetical protein
MFILLKKYKMKNLSKLLLVVFLAWAGYFMGMVVYGADCPSIFWGYICDPTANDVCNNSWWQCSCNWVIINHWVTCSDSIDPTADWITWTVTNGNICGDFDWCMCWWTYVTNWTYCSISSSDITSPILSSLGISVVNKTATFWFNSSEWPITISCLWSCGSCSMIANTWDNIITFSNLNNWEYNNCSIVWQDNAGNVSIPLNIPWFVVNYTAWWWSVWWGWGWTAMCSDIYLTCTNWIYTLKTWYYCVGWNLWKTCNVSVGTGVEQLLETIKEKSIVYEYTPQWVKIRIFVPKYRQALIRKTILSLNRSLYTAINKKLLKVSDPSYMIENFENLSNDSKIIVYKEIWAITKLYNDFLWLLYLVLDMKQRDYLPLARTYLETYFKEFAKFQK